MITYSPEEYIAALGDLGPLIDSGANIGSIDNLNETTTGGQNFLNSILKNKKQQNQLGPDDFGSYTIPTSDPSYSTGQQYARSIAGGIPMSQIMASGVSYSPEQPGGYTQQQLNAQMPQAPAQPPAQSLAQPPVYQEPDDMSVLGTGIGGYRMPYDRKQQLPPLNQFLGQAPAQAPGLDLSNIDVDAIRQQIADSGIDFTNLFGLPSQPDFSQFVTQEDLPGMIPQVPNGSDFSIENLNLPDFSNFVTQQDLPVYDQPDLSQFITQQDLPAFNPKDYRDDFLSIAREGIEMPSYQAPDLSGYDTRLADLEKNLLSLQQPVANDRFSVNQLNPRGLF